MTASMIGLAREGFHAPGIEEFEWPNLVDLELFGVNLGINRVVLQTFLVAGLVWLLFWLAFRTPRLVPAGLQNVMESLVDFIRSQTVLANIGPEGLRFLPYLSSLFVFIFFGTLGGILPLRQFRVLERMV